MILLPFRAVGEMIEDDRSMDFPRMLEYLYARQLAAENQPDVDWFANAQTRTDTSDKEKTEPEEEEEEGKEVSAMSSIPSLPARHPAWLLCARTLEKIAENCLRTGELRLGFRAILAAIICYQRRVAGIRTANLTPNHKSIGDSMAHGSHHEPSLHNSLRCLSTPPSAYGLLSVYCGLFNLPSWEQHYMAQAKDLFLARPSCVLDLERDLVDEDGDGRCDGHCHRRRHGQCRVCRHHCHSRSESELVAVSNVSESSIWNSRITLSNYEALYLIACGQLEDALNLLIEMQVAAADTFLGGHRSHRDLLFVIAVLFFLQGDFNQTALALEDLLSLTRAHKDGVGEVSCLHLLAFIHLLTDQPRAAIDTLEQGHGATMYEQEGGVGGSPLSEHQHQQQHTHKASKRSIMGHTLHALAQLRMAIAPSMNGAHGNGWSSDAGGSISGGGSLVLSSNPTPAVASRMLSASGGSLSGASSSANSDLPPNLPITRSLPGVRAAQSSLDSVFPLYARRRSDRDAPGHWYEIVEHMAMAQYLVEIISWVGGFIDCRKKEEKETDDQNMSSNTFQSSTTHSGMNAHASAGFSFSSTAPLSPFVPLSAHDSAVLRSLYSISVERLCIVHKLMETMAERFPWAHAHAEILAGVRAVLATSQDDAPASASSSVEEQVNDPFYPTTGPAAAISHWSNSLTIATDHHLTHTLAHAHLLTGVFLRASDPARRVHLQTSRAIFEANGCRYFASLAASAACHLSYSELGPPLQLRLSPFTAYSFAMDSLHAEKSGQFALLATSRRGLPTKSILRQATQHANANAINVNITPANNNNQQTNTANVNVIVIGNGIITSGKEKEKEKDKDGRKVKTARIANTVTPLGAATPSGDNE